MNERPRCLGAISGVRNVHVTTAAQFNGSVSSSGLILVDGTTNISTSSITTTGTQTYSGATTLNASSVLNGSVVTFGGALVGSGFDLTVNGNGVFNAVSGMGALHVTGTGTFGGTVGAGSVLVDGASAINTNTITTTGTQTYSGVATLGVSPVTLTGTTVTFSNSLVGTGQDLTVVGSGVFNVVNGVGTLHDNSAAAFHGKVSAGNVTVDGPVTINANITTTGTQAYLGNATLGTSATLTGTSVSFGGMLTGTTNNLAVRGNGTFQTIASLGNLSVTGAGTFQTITSLGSLSVAGDGTFGGNVTANSVLVGGNSFVTAASITTTGTQTYTGNTTVATNLNLIGSTVTFGGTLGTGSNNVTVTGAGVFSAVNGTGALTVNGPATFGGNITEGKLAVSGTTTINTGSITTTGTQTYTKTTTLQRTTVLSGSSVTFGTLSGGGFDLTVDGAGVFGPVAAMHNLTVNGPGIFNKTVVASNLVKVTGAGTFNGTVNAASLTVGGAASVVQNITTSGDQTYNGKLAVNLTSGDVTLLTVGKVPSGSTGSISINAGVTGAGSGTLTLQTSGPADGVIVNDTDHAMRIAGAVDLGTGSLNILNGGVVQFAPLGGTSETVSAAKISFSMPLGPKAPDQIVATIFDKGGDLAFNAGAGGFFMDHEETLTVFNPAGGGNLKIHLADGQHYAGGSDGSWGDIDVDSGGRPIEFQIHGNISLPDNVGAQHKFSQTTGVVSGGNVTMNGRLTIPPQPMPALANFKNEVWFSTRNPSQLHLTNTQVATGANGTTAAAQFFSFSQVTPLTGATVESRPTRCCTHRRTDRRRRLRCRAAVPRDVQTLQPERAATVAGTMMEELEAPGRVRTHGEQGRVAGISAGERQSTTTYR